jgi:hypothetical protein
MRSAYVALLMLAGSLAAHADFSFTMTQKSGSEQVSKHYLKGQKMKVDRGTKTTILDFEAQTLTSIDNAGKTYTVTKFGDLGGALAASVEVKADVKRTGEKKNINGYNAEQVVLSMNVSMPEFQKAGMQPQMQIELWVSRDVPGSQELTAFYRKNAAGFPLGAMGGNNPGLQKVMAKLQQQMAELDGVPVMEVIRMKSGGGAGPSAAQTQQMAEARAQLDALVKQGGPQAAAAQQALARMGGIGSGSGSLFEMTMEAGNFSAGAIPDSTFAIPAGYQKSPK